MRALVLAFAVLAASVGAAASAEPPPLRLYVTPNPILPNVPINVRLEGVPRAENVTNASLHACLASDGVARFCQLAQAMRVDRGNATLTARSADGFPAGAQAGVNVTIQYANGRVLGYPSGVADPSRAYYFYAVAGAPPGGGVRVDAPLAIASLGALALGALLSRRR